MTCFFESLVDDVVIQVFHLLSVWDLLTLRQTSKRMESLTHVRNVWNNIFKREVVQMGRPIPDCVFSLTPRVLALCGVVSEDDLISKLSEAPSNASILDLIESWDLETRSLHALRLEKRWKAALAELKSEDIKLDQQSISRHASFRTLSPIVDVFLLSGGRFAVTVHQDRLNCWDLSYPRTLEAISNNTVLSARCVGEWVFPKGLSDPVTLIDGCNYLPQQDEGSPSIVICAKSNPAIRDSLSTPLGLCHVLSVKDTHARPRVNQSPKGSPIPSPQPVLAAEAGISLPVTLQKPEYFIRAGEPAPPDEYGPHRFENGQLGEPIFVHRNLVCFTSFMPSSEPSDIPVYAGIEMFDWTRSVDSDFKSILLEYPDPQLGEYVGMHVYASAEAIVIVWQRCVGVYPLPSFSDDWSLEAGAASNRLVIMPSVVFALSEPVTCPISFSTCSLAPQDAKSLKDIDEPPLPLTILARSRVQPGHTVQSVITAMSVTAFIWSTRILSDDPSSPSVPSDPAACTLGGRSFRFRLTRIPAPTPYSVTQFASGQVREDEGVAALILGPSGRGVRVDESGTIYRCAPATVVLPRFASFGFSADIDHFGSGSNGGLCPRSGAPKRPDNVISTVDFWPYRGIDSLPEKLGVRRRPSENAEEVGEGACGNLVVRFDEGMGRMIAARVRRSIGVDFAATKDAASREENEDGEWACTVAVLDFA